MKKLLMFVLSFLILTPVWAEGKYSIKQMTLEVEQALNNRKGRFDQLRVLKSSGDIGENNQGYVEDLKHASGADALVGFENQDRRTIYQTIADQNGLAGDITTIEQVFAQVQRDKAQSGDQIQLEDGTWSAK